MSEFSYSSINSSPLDTVLKQGEKLRNAMVETILSNDQINANLKPKPSIRFNDLPIEETEKIRAFLQGDLMPRSQEFEVFETLRSMSSLDLCKATEQTYRSSCNCSTCVDYGGKGARRSAKAAKSEQTRNYLQFVDSLKITINSLVLNEIGGKKLEESVAKDKIASISQSFFLEYEIPDCLRIFGRVRSKVDSGLDCGYSVRICSRKTLNEVVHFKQTWIHDVCNLDKFDLAVICLKFRISFRNYRQKQAVRLGLAIFDFSQFEISNNLTCHQDISVNLDENTPLAMGVLRLSLQLGCGRLYFGKEFLDGVTQNRENLCNSIDEMSPSTENCTNLTKKQKNDTEINSFRLDLDTKSTQPFDSYSNRNLRTYKPTLQSKQHLYNCPFKSDRLQKPVISLRSKECYCRNETDFDNVHKSITERSNKNTLKCRFKSELDELQKRILSARRKKDEQNRELSKKLLNSSRSNISALKTIETVPSLECDIILFGYFCVKEAQFNREVLNSYFTAQLFGQDVACRSKTIPFGSNPNYNFFQEVPLIYNDDEFILKQRENFMFIEFFEHNSNHEFPIGLTKLSLHSFYLAYRNQTITKYLLTNKKPIVATNDWEPIVNPLNSNQIGECYVTLALGTREQIENLQITENDNSNRQNLQLNCKTINKSPIKAAVLKGTDIGTQVEVELEMEPVKESQSAKKSNESKIEDLLTNLIAQHSHNTVETSTNTEISLRTSPPAAKSASDLLSTLEQALQPQKTTFRAEIAINNALHLPIRKKCKAKKSKSLKAEDALPSTYVTFEPIKGNFKMTHLMPKCTEPRWDYKCEVLLPIECLADVRRALIFKVWRKSTNTTMQPNLQTDVVIGMASVDLTVLAAGLRSVQGWFNIQDLSKKINGQINIHVTPLEEIRSLCEVPKPNPLPDAMPTITEPDELLNRALKRKFTELDEITKRLRLRLSKVTHDESDTSNDDVADEFERDINSLCVEDDFDMVNFESEAENDRLNRGSEIGLLQTNGVNGLENNQSKIDLLLEKLTLLSAENNSRYVSGCSNAAVLNDEGFGGGGREAPEGEGGLDEEA